MQPDPREDAATFVLGPKDAQALQNIDTKPILQAFLLCLLGELKQRLEASIEMFLHVEVFTVFGLGHCGQFYQISWHIGLGHRKHYIRAQVHTHHMGIAIPGNHGGLVPITS